MPSSLRPLSTLASLAKLTLGRLLPQPNRNYSLGLLVEASDLPHGEWTQSTQQTYRMGVISNRKNPITVRARKAKTTAARRLFSADGEEAASLIFTVMPYATDGDASVKVSEFGENHHKVLSKIVKIEQFAVVQPPEANDFGSNTCVEYHWQTPEGLRYGKGLAMQIDNILLSVTCTKNGDTVGWSEVFKMTTLQSKKIRSRLTGSQFS
jgi:hypothetical protein